MFYRIVGCLQHQHYQSLRSSPLDFCCQIHDCHHGRQLIFSSYTSFGYCDYFTFLAHYFRQIMLIFWTLEIRWASRLTVVSTSATMSRSALASQLVGRGATTQLLSFSLTAYARFLLDSFSFLNSVHPLFAIYTRWMGLAHLHASLAGFFAKLLQYLILQLHLSIRTKRAMLSLAILPFLISHRIWLQGLWWVISEP
jgi:hypothetical protein